MSVDGSDELVALIMAGGSGTRFWPLSTRSRPKQFLNLFGDRSLLQQSFDRLRGLVTPERTIVLTNRSFVELVREQLPELDPGNIIGEPERKDTAAAVCLGALLCRERFGNPVVLNLTADHLIEPVGGFRQTMASAARGARDSGALYTCGIPPTAPATGYGYLALGPKVADEVECAHYRLQSFVEKPALEDAIRYCDGGAHLWNSGIFVWQVDAIVGELKKQLPGHVEHLSRAVRADRSPAWDDALTKAFGGLKAISIDYGVMEHARNVRCVSAAFRWSDVGGWPALRDHLPADPDGNCLRAHAHVLDAGNNLVFSEDKTETIVLVGVSDLVVVRAGDRTLISHRDRCEEVKKVVESLP